MPDLPPRSDFVRLWGIVQGAVRAPEFGGRLGAVTRDIYETYRQQYLAAGQEPPRVLMQDVNGLVSVAYEQRRAELALQRSVRTFQETGLDQAITREHMAHDIDASEGAGIVRPPLVRVRYGLMVGEGDLAEEQWVTWEAGLNAPASVAELLDQLEEDAANHSEDYGEIYSGLSGGISISFH